MRKFAKSAVGFEHPAQGNNHCGMCRHFIPDEQACRIVAGRVTAKDWCKKFTSKREARETAKADHLDKISAKSAY